MGHVIHHAIVVTNFESEAIAKFVTFARDLGAKVSDPVESNINRYISVMVAPDGSKSGWDESDKGDDRRNAIVGYLRGERYEDGSNCFHWVEIEYGGDNASAKITRHEWKD